MEEEPNGGAEDQSDESSDEGFETGPLIKGPGEEDHGDEAEGFETGGILEGLREKKNQD